jgi:hypothetical protein
MPDKEHVAKIVSVIIVGSEPNRVMRMAVLDKY